MMPAIELNREERRVHFKNMVDLLGNEDSGYRIAIEDQVPTFEIAIKSFDEVWVRARPPYNENVRAYGWDPRFFRFTDRASVLSFYLDFEERWNNAELKDHEAGNWLAKSLDSGGREP